MGTGIKRWEGFRGLRTYQPVLQADLRELERVVTEIQRQLGSLIEGDPIGGTTIINNESITNISAALADPTAEVLLTAVPGSATTGMRSDAAPPLNQAISPLWTGLHTFSPSTNDTGVIIQRTAAQTAADLFQILDEDYNVLGVMNNYGLFGINTDAPSAFLTIQAVSTNPTPPVTAPLAWYAVETIVEDAGSEPANGTSVSTWRDISGNGNDLTGVAGSGNTPAYYRAGHAKAPANLATVSFETAFPPGTAWGYFSFPVAGITLNTTDGWTIAFISNDYHSVGVDDPSSLYLLGSSADNNHQQTLQQSATLSEANITCSIGSTPRYYGNNGTWDTAGENYAVFRCEGDPVNSNHNMRMWLNGTLIAQNATSGVYDTTESITYDVLGAHFGSSKSRNLTVSEVIIFDRELTDVEVAALNAYLASRLTGTPLTGGSSYDLTHWTDPDYNVMSRVNDEGWLGIGVDPSYPLDVINTATQARIGYDTSNYYTTAVSATGVVTFNAVGAGSSFVFADAVTFNSGITVTGAATLNGVVTITSTTQPQFIVRYDSSNRLETSVSSAGAITMNAVGASAGFDFTDALTVTTTAATQLGVRYDASNRLDVQVSSAGAVTFDAVGASAAFTLNDSLGVGVSPTSNKFQVLSTTIPQVRLSYDTTHFTTHEVAADGSMVIRPNTDDTSGLIQCLIRPATALTSTTADGRATFAVRRSAGANPTSIICYANGLVEFGGSNGFATDAIIAVRSSVGKSAGIYFAPASSSSTGGTYGGHSNTVTGAYFATTPGATPAASNYVGGVFETALPVLSADVTGLYAAVFRPVGVSASNGARTITETYGWDLQRMPGAAGFGNFTTVYGGRIDQAFNAAPDSCTNDYRLYIDVAKFGSTINNGIFINCDATAGQRAIAIRSQNEYIHSGAVGNLTMAAGTDFVVSINGSDQASIQANLWQINVDPFDFQLPTANGTKWGTSTSEKQAWWGATPVTQPDGSEPVHTTLDTLGLRVDAGGDPYGIVCYENEVVCYDDVVVTI